MASVENESSPIVKLGGIEITTPKTQTRRFTSLIWGSSGAGKTTLAATAPGKSCGYVSITGVQMQLPIVMT